MLPLCPGTMPGNGKGRVPVGSVNATNFEAWNSRIVLNGTGTFRWPNSPLTRSVQAVGSILPLPILGGLHHRYVRA